MARASDAEKAERLNHARNLLRRFDHLPDAVDKMVRDCSVSPRQAYRYLQQAGRLKEDVPVADSEDRFYRETFGKVGGTPAFLCQARGLSLSDIVSRALEAFLPRRKKRG